MVETHGLASILSKMAGVMDGLLEVFGRQQRAIVTGDITQLEASVRDQEELAAELALLERERIGAAGPGGSGAFQDAEVERLRSILKERAAKIARESERNKLLLKRALEVVQHELGLVYPQTGYGRPLSQSSLVFDHRV